MDANKIWESVFSYDTYKKGAMFSASDIVSEPLIAKLRKEHGSSGIKWNDKISSFIGTAIHERISNFIVQGNPEAHYHIFKDMYGTIPNEFKEKLHEEYRKEKMDKEKEEISFDVLLSHTHHVSDLVRVLNLSYFSEPAGDKIKHLILP